MRKAHIALLVITAVLALSSAYSLAAMNQVFKVDFEWFSQLEGKYKSEYRNTLNDRVNLPPDSFKLDIRLAGWKEIEVAKASGEDFGAAWNGIVSDKVAGNIYIICSLGQVVAPEFRVKVTDMAQRGNNVEVRVSINTPVVLKNQVGQVPEDEVYDVVRINKNAFPNRGWLHFVFKDQDGRILQEQYCNV